LADNGRESGRPINQARPASSSTAASRPRITPLQAGAFLLLVFVFFTSVRWPEGRRKGKKEAAYRKSVTMDN
jgi:hypothetical protein